MREFRAVPRKGGERRALQARGADGRWRFARGGGITPPINAAEFFGLRTPPVDSDASKDADSQAG